MYIDYENQCFHSYEDLASYLLHCIDPNLQECDLELLTKVAEYLNDCALENSTNEEDWFNMGVIVNIYEDFLK